MRPTAVCLLRRSLIEVERKFRCDHELIDRFRVNRGEPAFHSLEPLGRRSFEDIYFDREKTLSSHGIWVRRRNGHWQAKIRQEGDYANSQFEELSKPADIARMIKNFNLDVRPASEDFGLKRIARYTTFREAWKVNNRFEVVLDTTDFNHCIGEVELEQAIEIDDDDESSVAQKKAMAANMDREIEAFMKQHPWAFPSDKPVGKLSAYFSKEGKAGSS
jgi:thiamine-triphosphatase